MADITGNTFSKPKNRSKVVFQKGRPPLDSEINELQDILAYKRKEMYDVILNGFSDTGFKIIQSSISTTNNFAISLGTLYDEMSRYNSINTDYVDQYTNYSFQTISPASLTTPGGGNRTDLVYLEVWPAEISSSTDSTMINSNLGIETAVRNIIKFAVKVAEGTTVLPAPTEDAINGKCYELAYLNRLNANASITTAMIEDRRHLIGTYRELIYEKRATPFKVESTLVNVLNENTNYGIKMISLSGVGGDREYHVSKIFRDDAGTTWQIYISDDVQVVCTLDTDLSPLTENHLVLTEVNESKVIGYVVVDWDKLPDGTDLTLSSTDLIIRDEYCVRDYSSVGQSISKTTQFRGPYAKIYSVDGDGTYRKGTLFKRDEACVTINGVTQTNESQEQEYTVSRVDNEATDISQTVLLSDTLSETGSEATFTVSDIYDAQYHSRVGIYLKGVGSGAPTDVIQIEIHNNINVLQGTPVQITKAQITSYASGGNTWIYVNYTATLIPGATYHYHIHANGGWTTTNPSVGAAAVTFVPAYRQFYKPQSGKFGSAINDTDVVHVVTSAGAEVVSDNVSTVDDFTDITQGYKHATGYDYMAADFSDTGEWDAWEYNQFIGVDLSTGRVKLPSALALNSNDLYAEFNTNNYLNEVDTKTIFIHETNESIEDYFREKFVNNTFPFTSASTGTPVAYSAGTVTVTHNFGKQYLHVAVVDNNDDVVDPDGIRFNSTSVCTLNLTSFHTITGTWKVVLSP